MPSLSGAHTAIFLARLARDGAMWKLTAIGETDHTARDWGSLTPEIKAYCGDIVPNIKVGCCCYGVPYVTCHWVAPRWERAEY